MRPRKEPNPALIWAVGPSRPPDPPDPIVIAEATSLTTGIRARMPRGWWWIGGDRRVRAVALGLRREAEDDEPGDQATERDDQRDRPRPGGIGDRRTPSPAGVGGV